MTKGGEAKRRGQSALTERLKYANRASRKSVPVEPVQTWLSLPRGNKITLPARFRHEDIRCADSLVEYCVNEFSEKGQVVFDPFAGYGTTLLIAEELGRLGYGIEYSQSKANYVQGLLAHPERLIHGDALTLAEYVLPPIDLCLTSPPYTNRSDTENPFVDYRQKGFDYPSYLQGMARVFSQASQKMKPSGRLVIEASNLKKDGEVTTLAWDIAREVSRLFRFEGEIVFCWEEYGYGYNHSYGLVFSKL
jgi:DNA modification methylase